MTNTRLITAHDVRHLCGGVSDMSLWRWLQSEELDFPRPIYIGRRRYWKEGDIFAWLEAQPQKPPRNSGAVLCLYGRYGDYFFNHVNLNF